MTWVKLDDHFFMHPKVLAVGPAAAWLWVASIGYGNANLTDGFVPSAALPMLTMVAPAKAADLAERLVAAGLWERDEGGYRVHDYHDWNPSAAEVRTKREHLAKVRGEAGRTGGRRSGRSRREATGEANDEANPKQVASSKTKQNEAPTPTPILSSEPPLPPDGGSGPVASEPDDPLDEPVREVFEHWRAVMGKGPRAVLSKGRESKIRARLAEGYGADELKRAVDACRASPHHRGHNDANTVYDDIELICRDQRHVDMFLAKGSGPRPVAGPRTTGALEEALAKFGPRRAAS